MIIAFVLAHCFSCCFVAYTYQFICNCWKSVKSKTSAQTLPEVQAVRCMDQDAQCESGWRNWNRGYDHGSWGEWGYGNDDWDWSDYGGGTDDYDYGTCDDYDYR